MSRLIFVVLLSCLSLAACAGADSGGGGGGQAGDGAADIAPFSLGLTEPSDRAKFQVRVAAASPAPPQKYRNDWVVELLDMDGVPLQDAELYEVQPFMPAHGHDGGFAPDVTADEATGEFAVDNINLWMGGHWEVRFFVRTPDVEDRAVVDVFIED